MLYSQPPKQEAQFIFGLSIAVRISTPTSSKEMEAFFMPKNTPNAAVAAKPARLLSTRTLAYCAMLAAVQVVLARLIVPMPAVDTRFSIEAVPVFLAGALFGPLAGGLVGFCADLVGCLFSGFGYNPIFSVPPILYGVCAGLFRFYLGRKTNYLRVLLAFLPAVVLGSFLWQSFALAYVYNSAGAFWPSLLAQFLKRGVQFGITIFINAAVTTLLFQSKVFHRLGVWPPAPRKPRGGADAG